jgi:hypothetical protein
MKKFRFFSVAVAVVAVLFVSAWAGSVTYGLTTLNGFATGETSLKCYTLTGPGTSYLTDVRVTGKLSSACVPATGQIRLYQLNGAQRILIGSTTVPVNTNFSNVQVPSPFPQNKYPANGSYCISGYVRYNNSDTQSTSCGITLTGNVTFTWAP